MSIDSIANPLTLSHKKLIIYKYNLCGCGGTADTLPWGGSALTGVRVQIPPSAPMINIAGFELYWERLWSHYLGSGFISLFYLRATIPREKKGSGFYVNQTLY